MRVISLNQRPQIPEKVAPGSMLDVQGTAQPETPAPEGAVKLDRDRLQGDLRYLPFHDQNFKEIKASGLPYSLLKGEKLKEILSELYRVLEPGGEVRIDLEVVATSHSIRRHWLREAPAPCRAASDEGEIREKLDQAGFEEMQVWKEASYENRQRVTLIAVKPGAFSQNRENSTRSW